MNTATANRPKVSPLIASRALARKIGGSSARFAIKEVRQLLHVVLVRYRYNDGNCCTFLSYADFAADPALFRIEGASRLPGNIQDLGGRVFLVEGSKGNWYGVDLALETCDCRDYERTGLACKHQKLCAAYVSTEQTEKKDVILAGKLAAQRHGW